MARTVPWGLLVAVVLFAGFGLDQLSLPGPYGDEVIQAAPAALIATGNLPTAGASVSKLSIVLFGRVWPFMALSYLGPVKTYVLAAAFLLFGVSVEVMRATTLAFGLIGLFFLYAFARRAAGRLTAEIAVLLVGLDTSFLLMSRDDWGPVVIGFAAKVAGLYLLAVWADSPRARVAPLLAGFAFGIGMTHKADFAWFLLALIPCVILFYDSRNYVFSLGAVLVAAGFLVGAAPLLYYNVESGWLTWTSPGASLFAAVGRTGSTSELALGLARLYYANFLARWPVLLLVLDGRGVSTFIAGTGSTALAAAKLYADELLVASATVAVVLAAWQQRSWRLLRPAAACVAMTALIFAQIVITPSATGPHHSVAVYPFPQLFVAYGLTILAKDIRWRSILPSRVPCGTAGSRWSIARTVRVGLIAVSVALVFTVLTADVKQLWQFETALEKAGGHGYWSDATDQAAAYVQARYPGQEIETLDWGLRDQFVMLLGPRTQVGFWAPDGRAESELRAQLSAGHRIFVLHTAAWTLFSSDRDRFLQMASDYRLGKVETHTFAGRGQVPSVVVVYIPMKQLREAAAGGG